MDRKKFNQSEVKAIAKALGHTSDGLTGHEIGGFLKQAEIEDTNPSETKWIRLSEAFGGNQDKQTKNTNILEFIHQAMRPSRYIGKEKRYETLRSNLNIALSFSGLEVTESGDFEECKQVSTLTEAEDRANELKRTLGPRHIHKDVLEFCKAELLQNNYFHAVFEAVKSVFDKLRDRTNSQEDGHRLANICFSGPKPKLFINSFSTKSEKMEQSGFCELIKGTYSMFRNPIAHEAKINWKITQRDAEDLLTLVSMIHRRIDDCEDKKSTSAHIARETIHL